MGLWWKKISSFQLGGSYELNGDENALSKATFGWRWQHDWAIFSVEDTVPWYRVSYYDQHEYRQYRQRVLTGRFAVRIGQMPTNFLATGPTKKVLKISKVEGVFTYDEICLMTEDAQKATIHQDRSQMITMI